MFAGSSPASVTSVVFGLDLVDFFFSALSYLKLQHEVRSCSLLIRTGLGGELQLRAKHSLICSVLTDFRVW